MTAVGARNNILLQLVFAFCTLGKKNSCERKFLEIRQYFTFTDAYRTLKNTYDYTFFGKS